MRDHDHARDRDKRVCPSSNNFPESFDLYKFIMIAYLAGLNFQAGFLQTMSG
jgi:hypothetical protein